MSDRRGRVPFDPRHFEKHGSGPSLRETFSKIYETDHWSGGESVSGAGSARDQTRTLERELPRLLRELKVRTVLDVPCGDFTWMQHVDLPVEQYIGGDIVPELVERNTALHSNERRRFVVLDLTSDPLPPADLILCRDALVHLSFQDISAALRNVWASGAEYLLTTTFSECRENVDIVSGDWRVLNLERPPFRFPPPLRLVNERCTEGGGTYRDKCLGLWRCGDLDLGP